MKTVLSTIGFAYVSDCIVLVGSKVSPSNSDWGAYLAFTRPKFESGVRRAIAAMETGGDTTPVQRMKLNAEARPFGFCCAVCTDSAAGHAVTKALSWFREGYRVFGRDQLEEATTYLGIHPVLAREVVNVIGEIRIALAPPLAEAKRA